MVAIFVQLLETLIFQLNNQNFYYRELGHQNLETDGIEDADHGNITLLSNRQWTATLWTF